MGLLAAIRRRSGCTSASVQPARYPPPPVLEQGGSPQGPFYFDVGAVKRNMEPPRAGGRGWTTTTTTTRGREREEEMATDGGGGESIHRVAETCVPRRRRGEVRSQRRRGLGVGSGVQRNCPPLLCASQSRSSSRADPDWPGHRGPGSWPAMPAALATGHSERPSLAEITATRGAVAGAANGRLGRASCNHDKCSYTEPPPSRSFFSPPQGPPSLQHIRFVSSDGFSPFANSSHSFLDDRPFLQN
jgi:hypothetical protein